MGSGRSQRWGFIRSIGKLLFTNRAVWGFSALIEILVEERRNSSQGERSSVTLLEYGHVAFSMGMPLTRLSFQRLSADVSASEENLSQIADRSEDTASSLLAGLRCEDADAWSRLVQLWTPLIYGYCRKQGFAPDDADDIVQSVLVKVFNGSSGFERDGVGRRFRYWIMAIVKNEIVDFCRRNSHRPPAVGGSEYRIILQNVSEPESESHSDWCQPAKVVARVLEIIKGDFQENNWKAFQLVEFECMSNQEAGERVGLSAAAVRQATFRIRQRLKTELEGMLE